MGYWVSCPLDSQNLNFSVAFRCSKSDSECVVVCSSQRRGTVCYNSVCSVQQLLQFCRPTAVPPRKKSWRRHCWKRLFSAGHMDSCIAWRPAASVRYGEMRWWCSDIPLSWTADGRYYRYRHLPCCRGPARRSSSSFVSALRVCRYSALSYIRLYLAGFSSYLAARRNSTM